MADHNELGKQGEILALDFLQLKGYELIAQNYRFQKAEIDLIMKTEGYVVFVEVKTRTSEEIIEAEAAITKTKQALIISAADEFLQHYNQEVEARFDVVIVIINRKKKSIRHIEDAFNSIL